MQVSGQANQRRLRVFIFTLLVALAVSLCFTWLRAPEYRASSRIEITPSASATTAWALSPEYGASPRSGSGQGQPKSNSNRTTVSGSDPTGSFLTELQVLTSRPILESVAASLARSGYDVSAFGADPVIGMQSRLEAIPVAGTNVVELAATAEHPELLAPLINTTIRVYQDRLARAYRESSSDSLVRAADEVAKLEGIVAVKRRDVEAFRMRNNIVSLEREENEVLSRVRNLGTSLRTANEKVAAAEGKLNSLSESAVNGEVVVRSKDNPTLANLEQRASQIRGELQTLERSFTAEYLAKDPNVVGERAKLAELERQIAAERAAGQQAALVEAKQELASAQGATARIQTDIIQGRQEAAQFTARFNEYKAKQDELAELEAAHRDAVQRRAKLEASEQERMPGTNVLEAATTPREPWRPLYWRDTAISVGGSLVVALLAMWLVELFNRPDPQPAVVLIQPSAVVPLRAVTPAALAASSVPPQLEATEPTLLPGTLAFTRELRDDEVNALVKASDDSALLPALLLLSGIKPEEVSKLRWSDVSLQDGTVRVGGEMGRDLTIGGALRRALESKASSPPSDLILGQPDAPLTRDQIDAQILCAAVDAEIDDATQVTADTLWHTYVAYLVRQGIRFADLRHIVGSVSPEALREYSTMSPPGTRTAKDRIDLLMPALR